MAQTELPKNTAGGDKRDSSKEITPGGNTARTSDTVVDIGSERTPNTTPHLVIQVPQAPGTVDELLQAFANQGVEAKALEFAPGGSRPFSNLWKLEVGGGIAVAKTVLPPVDEDHPDWAMRNLVLPASIQQERDGLRALGAIAATPRLIAEIATPDQTLVGVLREWTHGKALIEALRAGEVPFKDGLKLAEDLVESINKAGWKLWDGNPANFWMTPEGKVLLLEGQLAVPADNEPGTPVLNITDRNAKDMVHYMLEPYDPAAGKLAT
jgi:hypothetical protein